MKNSAFRALVTLIGLTIALSLLGASGAQQTPNSQTKSDQPQAAASPCPPGEEVAADKALDKLKAGNLRWQSRMEERNWSEEREETARCGQHPSAVVVTCMDSRVPPELIN